MGRSRRGAVGPWGWRDNNCYCQHPSGSPGVTWDAGMGGEGGEVTVESQHPPAPPHPSVSPPTPPNKSKPEEECVGLLLLGPPPSPHNPSLLPPSRPPPQFTLRPFHHHPPPLSHPSSAHNTCSCRIVRRLRFGFRLGGN